MMSKYKICYESELISHYGSSDVIGYGFVELSDEQAAAIRELVREKGTTDVVQLRLKEVYPEIYDILDNAYRELACKTETEYWMWDAYRNGNYCCDIYELLEYCKENLGFVFEPEEELDVFYNWLDDYVSGLDTEDCKTFFSEQMGIDVSCTYEADGYRVMIPEEILL